MKLKLDENGHAVLQDGKPVYVYDDGKEAAIDVADTVSRFTHLQAESKKAFAARDEAKKALAAFEGIEASAARDALDKLAKLDQKKLIDAGQVDAAVAAALKPVQDKLEAEAQRAAMLSAWPASLSGRCRYGFASLGRWRGNNPAPPATGAG